MAFRIWPCAFISFVAALQAKTAYAGMPSASLSDIAKMRLEAISFFVMGLVVSAAVIHWLWNWLAKDFDRLPRLTYGKSCALVVLWGLLFVVVLTMISGARELMTPGAWEKQGVTYKLAKSPEPSAETDDPRADNASEELAMRREQLGLLRHSLQRYAMEHDGQFPPDRRASGIPEERWNLPEPYDFQYICVPGRTLADGDVPLAYEPNVYGDMTLVLKANGDIELLAFHDVLQTALVDASK